MRSKSPRTMADALFTSNVRVLIIWPETDRISSFTGSGFCRVLDSVGALENGTGNRVKGCFNSGVPDGAERSSMAFIMFGIP